MELIEGESLAGRLAKGPLPADHCVSIAIQIAGALAAAHRRGVIHRDLKPANIMLTGLKGQTTAKVLDFGLAKIQGPVATLPEAETLTQKGSLAGTLQYMSPEQLQGKEADARSDIFAFGLVLYEMLTGRRAFEGESAAGVMAGILEREPPTVEPVGLNRVVQTCLAKDPNDRFQSADDLRRAIEWSDSENLAADPAPRARKWIPWAVAAVLGASAFLAWNRRGPVAEPPLHFTLSMVPPPGATLLPAGGQASAPEISPDGSSVLYGTPDGLWVRRLESLEPKLLLGSQGYSGAPFWSRDSKSVVFPILGKLHRVRVPDGAPEVVAELPSYSRGGTWSGTGTILISSNDRLFSVPAAGGERKPVLTPGLKPGRLVHPQFLPSSEDFLFLLASDDEDGGLAYLTTLRDGKAFNPIILMKNDTAVRYTPAGGGPILFVRNDNLYAQRLDLTKRKLAGEPELVQQEVSSGPGAAIDHADFSVSNSGAVAWRRGKAALNQVTVFDRRGKETGTAGPSGTFGSLELSPDETRLFALAEQTWLLTVGQPGGQRFGKGRWLWFDGGSKAVGRNGGSSVSVRVLDGSGGDQEIGSVRGGSLQAVTADGKYLLSIVRGPPGVFASRLDGQGGENKSIKVVDTGEAIFGGGFSPDGKWVVYSVGRGKDQPGVYVQPFPGPGLRMQVTGLTGFPVWRRDGKEIVIAEKRGVWSAPVEVTAHGLHFGTPQLLFSGLRWPPGNTATDRPLAVSRDGSHFYFPQAAQQQDSDVIHVTLGMDDK